MRSDKIDFDIFLSEDNI